MSLPKSCIQRPVTVLMFYAGVLLFGMISLTFLPQELFPPISYPKLSIVTNYENAAPEEIETLITKPIEEAVGSTPGLRGMTSTSREGLSVVVAEFGWSQRMDFAALAVREKIDLMKSRLPRDAQEPTVLKFNPFEKPVMSISVSSDSRSSVKLKRFTEKWFKDEFEKLNGVASATLSGGSDEEIKVELDQGRMKASDVGVQDISQALSASNINYPGGTIKESFFEYLVRTMGEFKSVDDIGKIVVGGKDPQAQQPRRQGDEEEEESPDFVLLGDIATIERTEQERTSYSRFNGHENVTVAIQKQASANTIQVADSILKKLEDLKPQMPADIRTSIIYNEATFIKDAINGVRDAAIQGGILAFIVLMIFLRKPLLSTLVVVITPVTIIVTFTVMYFMKVSINIISLGGIALCVGLLVDSAIVVIENVFRRVKEYPDTPFNDQVALACDEVLAPLFSSTLTTVVVFLPMIFVLGIVGQLVKDLALVVVIMLLISFGVAFTLLPVLITKFGRSVATDPETKQENSILAAFLNFFSGPLNLVQKIYQRVLPGVLNQKLILLMLVAGLFVFSLFVASSLDQVVMPKVDQGQFMVKADLPVGTRVEVTNNVARVLERYLLSEKLVENVSVVVGSSKGASTKEVIQKIGSHQAQIFVELVEGHSKSTEVFVQGVREDVAGAALKQSLRGAKISFVMSDSLFDVGEESGGAPIVVNIKGNSMQIMGNLMEKVETKLEEVDGVFDVTNSFPESSPETKIHIDKDKASFYRLSVTDLATAAYMSIRGIVSTKFKEEGREIPIRVVVRETDLDGVSKLPFLQMHSPLGITVPLAEIVSFQTGKGPSEIKRIGQERTIQVFAKIFDRSQSDVTRDVQRILDGIELREGYHLQLAGASLEVEESFNSLKLALLLSVILVYMIMASQFESYFQPFIIMFTLPLAIIGVVCALWVTWTPVSVIVLLGVMFLGGIVVNNGIILIDFTNQMTNTGMSAYDATVRASSIRFRPIMMTALTSILGLLPLALGLGKGVKLLAPMGIAQIGGLSVSTLLTLFVIPALYLGSKQIFAVFRKPKPEVVNQP